MDLSTWIHSLSGRWDSLDSAMKLAAQQGVYLAALVLLALWTRRQGLRAVVAALAGAAVALLLAQILGAAWDRPRPFVAQHFTPLFPHATDSSFPSDHLSALGAITAGAWLGSRALGALSLLLSLSVAFARVYAGVHYSTDVLAGFLIGAACATLAWYALIPFRPLLDQVDARLQRWRLRPA
jgi:undecaprenyl-diphosphatase